MAQEHLVRFYENENNAESYQFVFNVTETVMYSKKNQTGRGQQIRTSDWKDQLI